MPELINSIPDKAFSILQLDCDPIELIVPSEGNPHAWVRNKVITTQTLAAQQSDFGTISNIIDAVPNWLDHPLANTDGYAIDNNLQAILCGIAKPTRKKHSFPLSPKTTVPVGDFYEKPHFISC